MYSLSTCWNSHRHTDGRALLREVRELGFDHAELSHGTRISLMPGILKAVDAGEMKISSLHNFCPLPLGVERSAPNLYQFSSERERERELAVKYTLKTLDFAVRVNAPFVVLHLGSIELKDYTDKLKEMIGRGERDTPKYAKLCEEVVKKREAKKDKPVEHLYECLRKILPEAEKRGLKLGCENREALEELPFEPDFKFLFTEFPSPALTYWHDTGHAQIKENLGFIQHTMHLEAQTSRLGGFHIHDVQSPARDHCPPGSGTVDFAALKPFVKSYHIKVFEFSPAMSIEDLHRGVAHVKKLWGAH
jgi:sugar phosphate isomerase/epimerase